MGQHQTDLLRQVGPPQTAPQQAHTSTRTVATQPLQPPLAGRQRRRLSCVTRALTAGLPEPGGAAPSREPSDRADGGLQGDGPPAGPDRVWRARLVLVLAKRTSTSLLPYPSGQRAVRIVHVCIIGAASAPRARARALAGTRRPGSPGPVELPVWAKGARLTREQASADCLARVGSPSLLTHTAPRAASEYRCARIALKHEIGFCCNAVERPPRVSPCAVSYSAP